jgi:hypothetical protein
MKSEIQNSLRQKLFDGSLPEEMQRDLLLQESPPSAAMSTPPKQQPGSQQNEALQHQDLTREQWTAVLEHEFTTYGYPPLTDEERKYLNKLPNVEPLEKRNEEIDYWAEFLATQEIVIEAKMMASIEKSLDSLQALIQDEFNQIVHFNHDTPEESARSIVFGTALACRKIKADLEASNQEIKSFAAPKDFTPSIRRKYLAIVKLQFPLAKLGDLVTDEKFAAGRWLAKNSCVEVRMLMDVLQTSRTVEEDVKGELDRYLNVMDRT